MNATNMNKKLFSYIKKIGFCILKFLGISSLISCFGGSSGGAVAMYGVPGNFFEIEGTVSGDSDSNGTLEKIPEVKISVKNRNSSSEKQSISIHSLLSDESEDYFDRDYVKTNSEGKYSFEIYNFSSEDLIYEITFEDVDGEKNGSFEPHTEVFDFTEQDKTTEKEGWNKRFQSTKNITLKGKNK